MYDGEGLASLTRGAMGIVEGKDAERNSSLAAIHALALKSKLKAEDVTDALGNTIEFLSDICIDSPMAVEHVS